LRIKLFNWILKRFNFRINCIFSKKLRTKIESYDKFDLVIACGGGYLLTRKFRDIFNRLLFIEDCYAARIFNKPYILFNQSVGPFCNNLHLKILKSYFKNAKLIICREKISYNRLKKLNLNNIKLSSDIAFLLNSKKNNLLTKYNYSSKNKNIGITVRNWSNQKEQKKYNREITKFINEIINKNDKIRIYFMPQVIYEDKKDNDLILSNDIFNSLPKQVKKNVKIITEDLHPKELKYIISKMDFFIGTRMHSNIFALSSLVKTIAIAYESKTIGIMNDLNLSKYTINFEKVTKKRLLYLLQKLSNDKKYVELLQRRLEKVKFKLNN
jgi:colanic acid/amylovoran biosynthesis protein